MVPANTADASGLAAALAWVQRPTGVTTPAAFLRERSLLRKERRTHAGFLTGTVFTKSVNDVKTLMRSGDLAD